MAIVIAVLFVAMLWWWQVQKGRQAIARVGAVEPLPIADRVADAVPGPAEPQLNAAAPRHGRDPWAPAATPVDAPGPRQYAFASPRALSAPDRTAHLVRLARGKGLCSPRQRPS